MTTAVRPVVKAIDGGSIKSVDAALYVVDELVANLSGGNYQNGVLLINLVSLVNYLSNHGSAVEAVCREQLDRAFVRFRKCSQDGKLDYYVRRLMLYLIEMRANNWIATESVNRYYKTEEYFPMGMPDSSANAVPALQSPTLPLLGPGETIKSSGKYISPTKIPGKNYFKDEVVIRNSDSGKVMGIKGRRVHMIEELSETVISFQRVNPGAKERLVQITGPDETHINYAQQLMGDTIRRNASPVPFRTDQPDLERVGGSSSSVNSSASDESTRLQGFNPRAKLHHSLSSNDASLDAYKYTVKVGGNSVKITGSDYSLVMKSKLALDKFFESEPEQVEANEFFTSYDDEVCLPSLLPEPHLEFTAKPELSQVERPVSAFVAFRETIPLAVAATASRKYSRFSLCMVAKAEICKEPPADWETVCPAALRKTEETNKYADFGGYVQPSTQEPTESTVALRPNSFPRSNSRPVENASAFVDDLNGLQISAKPFDKRILAADTSVIYQSPLSIARNEAVLGTSLSALSPEFSPRALFRTSSVPPIYDPRALSLMLMSRRSSASSVSAGSSHIHFPLPFLHLGGIPGTVAPRGQEVAEGIIKTTIPFRPKLTNRRLNLSAQRL